MIFAIINLLNAIITLIIVVLLVQVVLSWLFAFDIVSRRNRFVMSVFEFTSRLTDPLLRPLRKLIPPIAGVDLSVLVLMLILYFIRDLLPWIGAKFAGSPLY